MNEWIQYRENWNGFIRDVLGIRLDRQQRKIVDLVRENKYITVRSGHGRGKDFTAAAIALTFLYIHYPSKVICTGPTQRQVISIMMAEIRKAHTNAKTPLGGDVLSDTIKFKTDADWYLMAFKTGDKSTESWTGFHSPNKLVIVTEASFLEDDVYNAIQGILLQNARLLLIGNPNRVTGPYYQGFRNPGYRKLVLSCLHAPNVRAKKNLIPGQVDYEWVLDKIRNWCQRIPPNVAMPESFDFLFEDQWYRPNDLFLVKVMGEFTRESEDQLIPLAWVEAANSRWQAWQDDPQRQRSCGLRLGVDIAGMGTDFTVMCHRYGAIVEKFEQFQKSEHMTTVCLIRERLRRPADMVFVDTIGEGAGVHSRLVELDQHSISAKFSAGAKKRKDMTGQRTFNCMRSYCWWAVRDALDPQHGIMMALPPVPEMIQDLTEPRFSVDSQGRIRLEKKEAIKKRLGRSPDWGDALALTFYPAQSKMIGAEVSLRV